MNLVTEEQMEGLRGALDAEKDSLEEEMAAHGKGSGENWTGSSESEGEEPDPADAADNIEELAVNVPLVADLDKRYRDVELALSKLKKGTYGSCETCGEPIPYKRLAADPAARTCIAHA